MIGIVRCSLNKPWSQTGIRSHAPMIYGWLEEHRLWLLMSQMSCPETITLLWSQTSNSGTTTQDRKCISATAKFLQLGQKETSSLQSVHRSCYDINNGVRPFCFDRAYQSAIAACVHPLKHRLLQTLNYWVAPAAHLSRQTNSFISPCAACFCTTSLPKTNKKICGGALETSETFPSYSPDENVTCQCE